MNHYFKISAVKPLSNKFVRICTLIPLFNARKIEFLKIIDKNVINDIYSYSGASKGKDDALDALSACYLLLSLEYKDKLKHFSKSRYI